MNGNVFLFYLVAAVAVLSAMGVIGSRNPMHAALFLVVTLFSMAVLFLLLSAEFLAVIQVLTYAGAILVLFLFIIMLLNLRESELFEKGLSNLGRLLLALVSAVAFVSLGLIAQTPRLAPPGVPAGFGSVASLGRELFTEYLIPFEIAGVLLTVALIGAVLLAKQSFRGEKK